ncbi:hypothetical protein ACTXT7_004886 [Hymenolepis weldensis]
MEASATESSLESGLLLTFPTDSLVSIIRHMSTEIKQLRSQVEILERRNATLQDRLPEIIQTTIRSTVEAFSFHSLISYLWPFWLTAFSTDSEPRYRFFKYISCHFAILLMLRLQEEEEEEEEKWRRLVAQTTLNFWPELTVVNNRQNSGNIDNGKSPNGPNAIPVSIDISGGGPVIPPTILSMANNLSSSSPPVSSLTIESGDFTELLSSLLHGQISNCIHRMQRENVLESLREKKYHPALIFAKSSPKNTPVEASLSTIKLPISVSRITSKSLGTEASNLPNLPPLTPPNSLKEEESKSGNDDGSIGEKNGAPPSFIIPMPPSPPRPAGARSEVSSLLSSEMMAQIEDQILSSSSMTERRKQYWQIYLNSKEWTRATCALMSCLFTRTQMANSTVLGRSSQVGGEVRHRLPATLVHYIVTKINQRFGVNPVKIRARMAQKCKDLRR